MFVVCQCAHYQANPKLYHLIDVTRIFKYMKGMAKLGIWYLKNSDFDLYAYADSNMEFVIIAKKLHLLDANFCETCSSHGNAKTNKQCLHPS